MKYRLRLSVVLIALLVGRAISAQPPETGSTVGVPVVGERGIRRTAAEIMAAQRVAPPSRSPLRMPEHEIEGRENLPQNPNAKPVASTPDLGKGAQPAAGNAVIAAANLPAPSAPQTIGLSFNAVTGPTENGAFPPTPWARSAPPSSFSSSTGD